MSLYCFVQYRPLGLSVSDFCMFVSLGVYKSLLLLRSVMVFFVVFIVTLSGSSMMFRYMSKSVSYIQSCMALFKTMSFSFVNI